MMFSALEQFQIFPLHCCRCSLAFTNLWIFLLIILVAFYFFFNSLLNSSSQGICVTFIGCVTLSWSFFFNLILDFFLNYFFKPLIKLILTGLDSTLSGLLNLDLVKVFGFLFLLWVFLTLLPGIRIIYIYYKSQQRKKFRDSVRLTYKNTLFFSSLYIFPLILALIFLESNFSILIFLTMYYFYLKIVFKIAHLYFNRLYKRIKHSFKNKIKW